MNKHIEQIRKFLQQEEYIDALDALVDLARIYANDSELTNQAILLNFQLKYYLKTIGHPQAGGEKEWKRFASKAEELLVKVQKDHLENQALGQRIAREEEATRSAFLHTQPAEDLVLKVRDITKTYSSSGFIFHPLSFELRLGEIIGVVGENGNGKTTLLRMLAGLLAQDDGAMSYPFLTKKLDDWQAVKQQLAYIPQRLTKWQGTVEQHLHFTAASKGLLGEENRKEVNFILHRLNLMPYRERKWEELSGGFQMRFELARMLVWKPKLLILDEPLAQLDINAQAVFLRDLRFLVDSISYPMAVVICSQLLHQVENMADKIIFLREGRAVFNGSVEDVGAARQENYYELICNHSPEGLKKILNAIPYHAISNAGKVTTLRTPLEVKPYDVLNLLANNAVELTLFRDFSRSTRQFFL